MVTVTKTANMSNALRGSRDIGTLNDGSRALASAAEQWVATTTECHREMIGFVAMRLEKDTETTREIMGCKNFAEMAAIQSQWLEETMRDYNSEMTKLMTIFGQIANSGGKTLK